MILGVGNILLTDEGAGVHAVQKLMKVLKHPNVELIDGGTMGLDLLPVFERCEYLIIIDCVKGGGEPGSIYRFAPEEIKQVPDTLKMSLHDFNLVDVLNLTKALGHKLPEIIIFGIEPKSLDWGLEPTPEVTDAIEKIVDLVKDDVQKLLAGENDA